jgi:peptidoglycan hydrolase CwlO-like protein
MKKLTLVSLTILAILLSACSAQTPQAAPAPTELSTESKLIVGTFKLDGTDQAITKEQAKQLVILWQVYQEINQSDTAAQEEVDGLLQQIEGTMTDAQMQAINGLNLSQSDVMSLMQEKGLMGNLPQISNSSSSSSSSGSNSSGGGAAMGAGGPPDMGGGSPMMGGG